MSTPMRSHRSVCWSCHGLITGALPFCPTCRIIQPPNPGLDYFQVFGLSVAFTVDGEVLEQRYQALQRQFHPDRFVTQGAKERRFSLEQVTRLNKAYETLKDPLLRGEYLVTLWAPSDRAQAEADPAFLMTLMASREALEALDVPSCTLDALVPLQQQTERYMTREQTAIEAGCQQFVRTQETHLLQEIGQATTHLRYLRRFVEALDHAEEAIYDREGY